MLLLKREALAGDSKNHPHDVRRVLQTALGNERAVDDLVPQELEDSERSGSRPHSKHNHLRRAQDAAVIADLRSERLSDEVVQDSEVRDHPVVRTVADPVPRVRVPVLVHEAPIRVRLRVIRVYLHTLPVT